MKLVLIPLLCLSILANGQEKSGAAKIVFGVAGPELLHAGITYRIAPSNLFGFSAGLGPSAGTVWPALTLEHRLYLGKEKLWFFRQGTTFFPSAKSSQQFTLTLTGGKDFGFKKKGNGITIDAGVFYLAGSEESSIILIRSLNLWPALRFQFYFNL